MSENLRYPAEVLVYGATVIHHSKRPLLQNYYNFTHIDDEKTRERGLFLAEPSNKDSHYSIYEDKHGTHIFDTDDLDMMPKITELVEHNYTHWKLDKTKLSYWMKKFVNYIQKVAHLELDSMNLTQRK